MSAFWQHLIRSGIALAVRGGIPSSTLHEFVEAGYRDLVPVNTIPLTAGLEHRRTRNVYEFFVRFCAANHMPPTIREVMRGCRITSTSVATYHMEKLTKLGLLIHRPGISRGYSLPQHYISSAGRWTGNLT